MEMKDVERARVLEITPDSVVVIEDTLVRPGSITERQKQTDAEADRLSRCFGCKVVLLSEGAVLAGATKLVEESDTQKMKRLLREARDLIANAGGDSWDHEYWSKMAALWLAEYTAMFDNGKGDTDGSN